MSDRADIKLAVLIDADNIPYSNVKGMMAEIAKFGTPTTKRIYGDWTKPTISGWKKVLLDHAITPVQQYSYTTGKNATDSAMIIDAMDILYSGKVNGFCLVSSDSDFTRLATRLRESGMMVIGIGEKKTPSPFIVACDKFIFLEILTDDSDIDEQTKKSTDPKSSKRLEDMNPDIIHLIEDSIEDLADEDGWAFLGEVGSLINRKKSEFDPRNYGFKKLTPLIKSLDHNFEILEQKTGRKGIKHVFVRVKKAK